MWWDGCIEMGIVSVLDGGDEFEDFVGSCYDMCDWYLVSVVWVVFVEFVFWV